MPRLAVVLGIVAVVVVVYSLVDCAMIERSRVRGLPRWAWLVIMILLPLVGTALWFLVGRAKRNTQPVRRQSAPDDDVEFLRRLGRDAVQEERIRKLEEQLADLDGPDAGGASTSNGTPPVTPPNSPPQTPRKPDASGEADAGPRDA